MQILHRMRFRSLLAPLLILAGTLTLALAIGPVAALAQSPFHPTFPLLDTAGDNVLESGQAVSTMTTCGACHDASFIAGHSYHVDAGLGSLGPPGSTGSGRSWDTSPGLFGRWNPISYRYLSPADDPLPDLTTPAWLQTLGLRHVGGGPATIGRSGEPLTELGGQAPGVESGILDPEIGDLVLWDWERSGVVEMNCFLCHLETPNNQARIEALQAGEFGWANAATLLGSGIVARDGEGYAWNKEAFDQRGELLPEYVSIQDPENENCGQCHGLVHDDLSEPLTTPGCVPDAWMTQTTGQIISPQRLSESGMNLLDKPELDRAWDIHAERLLKCTDCHYSLNNPVYTQGQGTADLDHLLFDPRRLELGEYLLQPSHDFARGASTSSAGDSMRGCDSCHDAGATHGWLPYQDRHLSALACETCHIPQLYTAAFQQFDWTVLQPAGQPRTDCRGVSGKTGTIRDLVTGYTPVLMPRAEAESTPKLAPYNLVAAWYWVYGEPARPVRLQDLQAVWLDGEGYAAEVLSAFDRDGDGNLSGAELVIDTPEREALIAGRLSALGLEAPRIQAEVQPYGINHNVIDSGGAIRDCQTCHGEASRITMPIRLAGYLPGGVMPNFVDDSEAIVEGDLVVNEAGELHYQPLTEEQALYLLGHQNVSWIDLSGALIFLGTLGAVVVHGGLRVRAARRRSQAEPVTKQVYLYSFYERLWHWLQTVAILLLTFTGLVIHKPDVFGFLSFRGVVLMHNIVAGTLIANAILALFYNLVSGDIRRFVPKPQGFFNQAIVQVRYYTRGIFRGDPHPFEKTRQGRLNPLQKITYFGILNVFLPLQILTGILMWGVQRWPELAGQIGGLAFLAPFHTLIAWLFASFILAHIYLTTTGPTPMAGIKSMILGWDQVELHEGRSAEGLQPPGLDAPLLEEGN